MKVIGIEIDNKRAICYAVEKDNHGSYINLTGKFKSLSIKDDYENSELRNFQSTIHTFFEGIVPQRIAVLKRQTKGRFASSAVSFKLEGLIQCYEDVEVEFVSPQTLKAYYKKNGCSISPQHNYQDKAVQLANYLLNT
ncbi:MAG: DUF3010 family protein [Flavobacteriales bacterium]|nr:DUF3010 family protein [Flavobacteriales bacterium]